MPPMFYLSAVHERGMARIKIDRRTARLLVELLLPVAETEFWNDDLDRLLAVCYEVADE